MVIGVISPKIILPQHIVDTLSSSKVQAVMLHEQAHIDRYDLWISLFQKFIAAIFWWSPVIRYLDRKIHISRELACDARAAQILNSGKQYAQSLLDCARMMVTQNQPILAMGFFSKKKELEHRIKAVLHIKSLQKTSKPGIILACFILSFASVKASQFVAPKVNIKQIKQDAKPYYYLSKTLSRSLKEAVNNHNINAIKTLIQNGLDINRPIRGDGTALIMAVRQGDQQFVNQLIELGTDVNQAARGDANPLIIAAMTNQIDIAASLIQQGAELDAIVIGDETALINASWQGHYEMVKFLVEQGADVNLSVRAMLWDRLELRSPLKMAKTDQIRQYLIQNGAIQ